MRRSLNYIKIFPVLIILLGLVMVFTMQVPAYAQQSDPSDVACQGIEATGADCQGGERDVRNTIRSVVNILFYIVGIAAVVTFIIGAIRLVLSGGDPQAVASARNTMVYAVVGVVVAVLAIVIVRFVFDEVGGTTGSNGGGAKLSGLT
ncbi:MAG TPA: hypothetical protein VGA08_02555 [Candidatus Saccharimonadales bacterium]